MSATFSGPLSITQLDPSWRLWSLNEFLEYDGIFVPPGFITDGASVPRLLWWLFPAWGSYGRAAVIHDFLCQQIALGIGLGLTVTRKMADLIFRDAMKASGTGFFTRWTIYLAVRIFALVSKDW